MTTRVLIADDEELARAGLAKMLASIPECRCEVEEASDGEALLESARRFRPQLCFVDIRMPGLNGMDAAAQILAIIPDTRIVIVTAFDRFSLAQRAVNLGLDGYLLKPVLEEEFRKTVVSCLARIERGAGRRSPDPEPGDVGSSQEALPPSSGLVREENLIRLALHGLLLSPAAEAENLIALWTGEERIVRERLASFCYAFERESARYRHAPLRVEESMLERLRTEEPRAFLEAFLVERCPSRSGFPDPIVAINQYFLDCPTAEISLEGLAGWLGLSPSYASRLFRESTGRNFAGYVAELRLERALAIAESEEDMPLEELARRVGYSDSVYFGKLFRERAGMSPREWARSRRRNPGP